MRGDADYKIRATMPSVHCSRNRCKSRVLLLNGHTTVFKKIEIEGVSEEEGAWVLAQCAAA